MTPEAIAALHARAFAGRGRAWSAAEFAALLDSRHVFAVGDAKAFALGRVIAGEAELLTLATAPDHRRAGLGRAVLTAFEVEAMSRGATRLFLEVAEDNHAAVALYTVHGYRQVARRDGYYRKPDGSAVDALIYQKSPADAFRP